MLVVYYLGNPLSFKKKKLNQLCCIIMQRRLVILIDSIKMHFVISFN